MEKKNEFPVIFLFFHIRIFSKNLFHITHATIFVVDTYIQLAISTI